MKYDLDIMTGLSKSSFTEDFNQVPLGEFTLKDVNYFDPWIDDVKSLMNAVSKKRKFREAFLNQGTTAMVDTFIYMTQATLPIPFVNWQSIPDSYRNVGVLMYMDDRVLKIFKELHTKFHGIRDNAMKYAAYETANYWKYEYDKSYGRVSQTHFEKHISLLR